MTRYHSAWKPASSFSRICTPKCSLQYRRASAASPIWVISETRLYIANHRAFWSSVRSLPGRRETTTNFLSRYMVVRQVMASESLAWQLTEIFSLIKQPSRGLHGSRDRILLTSSRIPPQKSLCSGRGRHSRRRFCRQTQWLPPSDSFESTSKHPSLRFCWLRGAFGCGCFLCDPRAAG